MSQSIRVKRALPLALLFGIAAMNVMILLNPTSYSASSYASLVQSLAVIQNLRWFIPLFTVYMALCLTYTYLFGQKSVWLNILLLLSLASVWLGFWLVTAPYGRETLGELAQTVAYQKEGTINIVGWNGNLDYLDFPGLYLVALFLWDFTGLDILAIQQLTICGLALTFPILAYVLYRRFTGDERLALTGVILLLVGGIYDSAQFIFQADSLGLYFVLLSIVILSLIRKWDASSEALLLVTISSALLTNLMSSVFIAAGISGIWVLWKARWLSEKKTSFSVLLASILLIFAYLLFTAQLTFHSLTLTIFKVPLFNYGYLGTLASNNFGPTLPLWVSLTREIAVLVTVVIGGLMMLATLACRLLQKRKDRIPLLSALFFGYFFTSLLVLLPQGGAQIARPLLYLPLLDIIPVVSAVLLLRQNMQRVVLPLFLIGLLVLSVPAFFGGLEGGTYAAITRTPPDLVQVDYFLRDFAPRTVVLLFSIGGSSNSVAEVPFFLVNVTISVSQYPINGVVDPQAAIVHSIFTLVQKYDGTHGALWILSQKDFSAFQHLAGIEPSDPVWNSFKMSLETSNLVYGNSFSSLYSSTA